MRELFESTIERLLADLSTPEIVLGCENGGWPATLWSAVEESGFCLAAAPEALGGAGAGWDDLYAVVRAAGRHNAPVPLPEAMLANWLLGQAGLEAIGGPLAFAAVSALTIDNGSVLGTVTDVPWGRHVDYVVAIADSNAPTVVLLPTRSAERRTLHLNTAGEPRDDLAFAAVAPTAMAPLPSALPRDALLQGGAMLRVGQISGALHAALDLTTRYAGERVQFGKPIGAFQTIQHQIAVLAEQTGFAAVAAEAAFAESMSGLALLPIAVAKVCTAEAASEGARIAHAVHGAIGFTHEHSLHLSTRRLWAWRSEFGSLTVWSQRLGRAICAAGAAGFWPLVTRGSLEMPDTAIGVAQ